MTREWRDPYNSFNSYKGLIYAQHYDAVLRGDFLPPIEVAVDPVNNCNFRCFYCNGSRVIERGKRTVMRWSHLQELIDFFEWWGVKAVCYAGGGEPVLHPHIGDAMELTQRLAMEAALITNGDFQDVGQLKKCAQNSRWIGVSVDAATPETFHAIKGVPIHKFWQVLRNGRALVEAGCPEVTYKVLVNHLNQYELLDACRVALSYGFHQVHIRPVSYLNFQNKEVPLDTRRINEQIDEAFATYDSDRFRVFAVRHKFNDDLTVRKKFSKCIASPIMAIFEANGNVELCLDRKGEDATRLCRHDTVEEVLENWGSLHHRQLLRNIDPQRDCPKCTFGIYNELAEAYEEDRFCWKFT